MEWETYFQKRILDRGYDYYFDERVEDLRINSNRIKAVVNGTDFYHVEIKLNGNKIKKDPNSEKYYAEYRGTIRPEAFSFK